MYLKKIKIGNLEIENNIFLAPMAGITDLAYRRICKEYGAGLTYTEMLSSKAIFYNDEKTKLLMKTKGEKDQLHSKFLAVMKKQWGMRQIKFQTWQTL